MKGPRVLKRHRSRQVALQVLYASEYLHEDPQAVAQRLIDTENIPRSGWNSFSQDLIAKTRQSRQALDEEIQQVLQNWRIERISKIDICILRLALCEMKEFQEIPVRVTINECIELAKEFGTDESSAFVNGVLDKLGQRFPNKNFDPSEPKSEDE